MTENSVSISITIKVSEREIRYEKEVEITGIEETIQNWMTELEQKVIGVGIRVIDDRIAGKVSKGWQNLGTEDRWIVSSVGALKYRRGAVGKMIFCKKS